MSREDIYTLRLTKDEVLMLQRVIGENREHEGGYQWEMDIKDRLSDKAAALYPKRRLPRAEFERRLQREYEKSVEKGFGETVADGMRRSEEHRLRFYYAIEEAEAC